MSGVTSFRAILVAVAALALGACSRAASPSDEQYLASLDEFSAPVKLSIPIDANSFGADEAVSYGVSRACILSKLADTGVLSIVPLVDGTPWWRLSSTSAETAADHIAVPIGSRVIKGKSADEKSTVDGKNYYAATYAYVINTTKAFPGPAPRTFGPFSVRVTFVDDPAAKKWIVADQSAHASPTGTLTDENAELTRVMNGAFPEHTCTPTITNRLAAAKEAAFATIGRQLGQSGIIARTQDPNVLWSKNSGLDWYVGSMSLAGRALAEVPKACAALKAQGAGAWRMPTSDEMKTLISVEKNGNQWPGKPYDTPDHRFFGAVITSQADQSLRFYTSNSWPIINGLTDFDTFEFSGFNGQFVEQPMEARSAAEVRLGSFDRVLCVSGRSGGAPTPTS